MPLKGLAGLMREPQAGLRHLDVNAFLTYTYPCRGQGTFIGDVRGGEAWIQPSRPQSRLDSADPEPTIAATGVDPVPFPSCRNQTEEEP